MHNSENDWEENLYNSVFDAVYLTIKERYRNNPNLSYNDIKTQYEDLCVLEGHDQYGRGRVADIDIEASVAAMQSILADWDNFTKEALL